ncbi:class I SAM-dependent methyltransferase [Candidatus Magnetominusculus dajiuhuensis]|uniref:class I SAM-dependent methyltransferase n=1 Tax=Candidatus Magnetominusculus dajiuhuensis TaxID=3137712 RepID=UPI003B42CFE9
MKHIDNNTTLLTKRDLHVFEQELAKVVADFCRKYRKTGAHELAREFLSEQRAREQLDLIKEFYAESLQNKRLLEIGSGYGMFLLVAHELEGANVYGIEPAHDEYMSFHIARRILESRGMDAECIVDAVGENIPFESNYFDIVYSSNVLEHVNNPPLVLQEAYRVLKPGGIMIFVVPNFNSFWEGHYSIPWLPIFNLLPLGRLYVRVLGRDPAFLDTLQFVTPAKMDKWLSFKGEAPVILSNGKDLWARRMRSADFSSWGGLSVLKKIVAALKKLHLTELTIKAGYMMNIHTPIVLVVRKPE